MAQHTKSTSRAAAEVPLLPRILVVEDDVLVRVAAAQYLRGRGFPVLEAVNVDEAVDILRADSLVRVVFADVARYRVRGYACRNRLSFERCGCPRVDHHARDGIPLVRERGVADRVVGATGCFEPT